MTWRSGSQFRTAAAGSNATCHMTTVMSGIGFHMHKASFSIVMRHVVYLGAICPIMSNVMWHVVYFGRHMSNGPCPMSCDMWNIHNKMHIDVKMRKKDCLKLKLSNFMENNVKQIDEKKLNKHVDGWSFHCTTHHHCGWSFHCTTHHHCKAPD